MRSFTSIGRLLAAVFVIIFIATGVAIAGDALKVNINNATVEELTQLKRIGPKYAEKTWPSERPTAPSSPLMNW